MNDADFDSSERKANGVKKRADGNGDGWANAHRDFLGNGALMQDLDCMFGAMAFGHNTADRLFMEYVPDNYANRTKSVRRFGLVALFDRKMTEPAAFHNRNMVSKALYLWLCRIIANSQNIEPKFFYVCGGDEPPWDMVEMNIYSGEKVKTIRLETEDWKAIWETLGLTKIRSEIAKMIQ